MVKKICFKVFSIISLWILLIPRTGASLDPRIMIGRIYVWDHMKLQHTKQISCGPHGFRDFEFFPNYKSMETLDPQGGTSLGWQDLCKGPHTKFKVKVLKKIFKVTFLILSL